MVIFVGANFRMNYPLSILNIRTAQDSDIESIVQGNFSYDALHHEIYEAFHHTKIPAIRYNIIYPTALTTPTQDIIDTGGTMMKLLDLLKQYKPANVKVAR